MERLFTTFDHAIAGSPAVALAASFVWGILSVILSPCHLSSIPLIVGFVSEQTKLDSRRALGISSVFAVGILITIGLLGILTAQLGRLMGDVGPYGSYLVAGVFFLFGLHMLDVVPMPWSGPGQAGIRRRGLLAALILGLMFGTALGPCTFAFMGPVLGVSFAVAPTDLVYAVLLIAAYGIGHCAVIVAAGTSTELVQRYLNWNEASRGTSVLKKACGLLVLIGGVYMVYRTRL